MTRDEFYKKYGDVKVAFSSYYKYTFNFTGTLEDGSDIVVSYGGNSDEIYRFELIPNNTQTIIQIQPYSGTIYKNNKEIEGFYDY